MRTTVLMVLLAIAGTAIAASPDPIRLGDDDLTPDAFPESKQILTEELAAGGRYGPVPERYKRQIRGALQSIERMLVDPAAPGVAEAVRAEADEINDILARADSKVGRGRCEERKPIGSNIRHKTVCRDSETMYAERENAERTFRQLNKCQMKPGSTC